MIAALALLVAAGPQLTRLPNGIPVVVETTADQLVSIQVLIRADDLDPRHAGALEFLSGALFGETENYSLRELRNLAWSVGGVVDAAWAGDCLRLEVTTTPDRLRPAAAFLSDVLRKPLLTPAALTDARALAVRRLARLGSTPPLADIRAALATNAQGAQHVRSLDERQSRETLRFVDPSRTYIGVVGNVSPEAVATIFSASLGNWQSAEPTPPNLADSVPDLAGHARIVVAEGPTPNAPDFPAWIVACVAVGEGKMSVLNAKFRQESGQAYLVGTALSFRHDRSFCAFYVSAKESPLDAVRGAQITDQHAQRARAYAAGRYQAGGVAQVGMLAAFAVGHETSAFRAFWHAWWQMRGADVSKDRRFADEIAAVTPNQARDAHDRWLKQAKEASPATQ